MVMPEPGPDGTGRIQIIVDQQFDAFDGLSPVMWDNRGVADMDSVLVSLIVWQE
jgi:hypothetical protein